MAQAARSAMGGKGPDLKAFFPHLEEGGTEVTGADGAVVAGAMAPPAEQKELIRVRKP